ncbi:MAG TPA: hypothetical protein ENJ88_00470 [Phaeodactylibacter sp.]|nr:hypothetical protein [Phaeodactylibacter sp.]
MTYTSKALLIFFLALCLPRIGHAQPPLSFFFASANASHRNTALQMHMQEPGWPLPPTSLFLGNQPALPVRPGLLASHAPHNKYSPYQIQTNQWPLFCRLEWQWEKTTALPWKFRLGNLDYVNQLEGK